MNHSNLEEEFGLMMCVAIVFVIVLAILCKCHEEWLNGAHFPQNRIYSGQDNIIASLQQESFSPNRYDLHGMSVSGALGVVQNALTRADPGEKVFFIAGRGLHSSHGYPAIKRAVEQYLQDRGYRFWEISRGGQIVVQM